mmetsp:Transcript_138222/g.359141  ORF Transcript_138222/g.359141 Transcript_138222/m.359141 type:complete len:318 (+) Transcript_138222:138-1091(+)
MLEPAASPPLSRKPLPGGMCTRRRAPVRMPTKLQLQPPKTSSMSTLPSTQPSSTSDCPRRHRISPRSTGPFSWPFFIAASADADAKRTVKRSSTSWPARAPGPASLPGDSSSYRRPPPGGFCNLAGGAFVAAFDEMQAGFEPSAAVAAADAATAAAAAATAGRNGLYFAAGGLAGNGSATARRLVAGGGTSACISTEFTVGVWALATPAPPIVLALALGEATTSADASAWRFGDAFLEATPRTIGIPLFTALIHICRATSNPSDRCRRMKSHEMHGGESNLPVSPGLCSEPHVLSESPSVDIREASLPGASPLTDVM